VIKARRGVGAGANRSRVFSGNFAAPFGIQ
jgi:hypothetical protein